LFVGVVIGIEDFDFYQEIKKAAGWQQSGNTLGFQRNGPSTYLILIEGAIRAGYRVPINPNRNLNFILTAKLGYFTNEKETKDTTEYNRDQRKYSNSGGFEYFDYGYKFKTGLNYLASIAVEHEWKLGVKQKFSLATSIIYQQGLRYFFEYTGYMAVTGSSEGIYKTKVSGTSLQLNLGLKYNFGFKQKVRMLQPF
jgi:hypothetical protein